MKWKFYFFKSEKSPFLFFALPSVDVHLQVFSLLTSVVLKTFFTLVTDKPKFTKLIIL